MFKYDFLVAVVRDRLDAASLSWGIFLAGGSVMFLIALIILCSRTYEPVEDNHERLKQINIMNDE